MVTAGADKTVCVLEPRMNYQSIHRFNEHKDYIYSLTVVGDICISGDGQGHVIAHNINSGEMLWDVKASESAVRCLHATPTRLVAAGDDGSSVIYKFDR